MTNYSAEILNFVGKINVMKRFSLILYIMCSFAASAQSPLCRQTVTSVRTTTITLADTAISVPVNPLIYGQMLEDCNDRVVYGGIVDEQGRENESVTRRLLPLEIPVVRWPAGTAIYDYEWRRGIGPERVAAKEAIWGGTEHYTFGTDEFIAWCRKIGAEPYINIPMGNNNSFAHSLGEALDWVEYVNGAADSPMGALRKRLSGHEEPYGVKYWCLGNENYLGNRFHESESAAQYASLLDSYASVIKSRFPTVKLLGVGRADGWNKVVLERCGRHLDFLTLHYYLTGRVRDRRLEDAQLTLFAPARMEAGIRCLAKELTDWNTEAKRTNDPVRFSIDEWNCRHSVWNGARYGFTRQDARRLYDAAAAAGMLNVFIRQSQHVAMANYIFPVNGHGLVKTTADGQVYESTCYPVFQLYRKLMRGHAIGLCTEGPGVKDVALSSLRIDGDIETSTNGDRQDFCFVDCAAVKDPDGRIVLTLVNRSYDSPQTVSVKAIGSVSEAWVVCGDSPESENTLDESQRVAARPLKVKKGALELKPCAVAVVAFRPASRAQ